MVIAGRGEVALDLTRCGGNGEGSGLYGEGATGGGQVIPGLPSHPECGVAPTYALQGEGHFWRDSTVTIQQAGSGVAAHLQLVCKVSHAPACSFQAVLNSL